MMSKSLITYAHGTHVGCVRDHNEDAYASFPGIGLWVIADGMGGYDCGEVASALAIEHVARRIKEGALLHDAIAEAHQVIKDAGKSGHGAPGMGTTIVALKMDRNNYEVAWVGDSRAYLWNGTRLEQLTVDHSYVQQLLQLGAIDAQEAINHPQQNLITQALGSFDIDNIKVDTISRRLYRGEMIMLCSDGLTSELNDTRMAKLLSGKENVHKKVDRLLQAALKNGGNDNVTIILAAASDEASSRQKRGDTAPFDTAALTKLIKKRRLFPRIVSYICVAVIALLTGILLLKSCSDKDIPKQQAGGNNLMKISHISLRDHLDYGVYFYTIKQRTGGMEIC